MTYNDLVLDIAEEAGDSVVNAKIPKLIKEVERYLWTELPGLETSVDVTISSGSNSVSQDMSLWKKIKRAYRKDNGDEIDRISESEFQELYLDNSDYTEVEYYVVEDFKTAGTIKVYGTPDDDLDLAFVVRVKEGNIGIDTAETAFFLDKGYSLLKYGVLALRVLHPDKHGAWSTMYQRELKNVRATMSAEKVTNRSNRRRWF